MKSKNLSAPPPASGRKALVWFRRDLRDFDHTALHEALKSASRVWCVFIYDTDILDRLPTRSDRRVEFILGSVNELRASLRARGGDLWVLKGSAAAELCGAASRIGVHDVYANHDYEPSARERDEKVRAKLTSMGIEFRAFKDQVIFEKEEILTGGATPFKVFTAYKNAWLDRLDCSDLAERPIEKYQSALARPEDYPEPTEEWTLEEIGFVVTDLAKQGMRPGMSGGRDRWRDFLKRIDRYRQDRDFPALKGPSYLSIHLRFGTVSIRELAREAERRASESGGADCWLGELIWRDFYFMILWHHPRVVGESYLVKYKDLPFENDKNKFAAWCEGRTGYPIVDAAMRQLNKTGYMHNRLRMVAASFLVKDLHVDWRKGEKYFAERLLDFDLSANNGGWQWSASTGCDAQPYFRIFNPVRQSERFDPKGDFIRRYVPEAGGFKGKKIHAPWTASAEEQAAAGCVLGRDYPFPVTDHAAARRRTMVMYTSELSKSGPKR
jgi:deoxyribodipyrimidine photo-lyase